MPKRRVTTPIPYPPLDYCSVPIRSRSAGSDEATKLKAVLDYFNNDTIQLAQKEGEKGTSGLNDVEKMFLVSFEVWGAEI